MLGVGIGRGVEPLSLAVDFDLLLVDSDPRWLRRPQNAKRSNVLHESFALVNVGGSACASESVCVQLQTE